MDNLQAKFLLRAARPDDEVADPLLAEALAQARRDPELARWLREEQELDALLYAKLGEIAPPPGLRDALSAIPKVTPMPARSWRPTGWLALAAALAVLATLAGLLFRGEPAFPSYEKDLVGQIASGQANQLSLVDPRLDALKAWLAQNRAPHQLDVPAGTGRLPCIGCRTFTWRGRQIAQVCFALDDGKIVHLFVIRQGDWHSAPPEGHPQFSSHGDWTLASWRDGGDTYVMARIGSSDDVLKLFN